MSQFGPEEAIGRIDAWKGHDVRYEELGGGITNHNYIVWIDGATRHRLERHEPGLAPTRGAGLVASLAACARARVRVQAGRVTSNASLM